MKTIIVLGTPQTAMAVQFCVQGHEHFTFGGLASNFAEAAMLVKSVPDPILLMDDTLVADVTKLAPNGSGGGRIPAILWSKGTLNRRQIQNWIFLGVTAVIPPNADRTFFLASLDESQDLEHARTNFIDSLYGKDGSHGFSRLTPRELETLNLAKRGLTNKRISEEMGIAPSTVKIHLTHIFEKTGIKGRDALIMHSLRSGSTSLTMSAE